MFDGDLERTGGIAIGAQSDEVEVVLIVDRPECGAVGVGQGEQVDRLASVKTESSLRHRGRQVGDGSEAFEEEEQPVRIALVGFLGDHREEVEVGGGDRVSGLFKRLANGAFER